MASVQIAKEHIAAGDVFQVVLSQRFSAPIEGDGLDLYRVLRAVNPSPYMFYVRTRDVTLVGSSPEPLVRVEGDEVLTRPLAGTRPRGATAPRTAGCAPTCSPTRRSAPSTSCSSTWAATTSGASRARHGHGRRAHGGRDYSHVMHIVSNVTGRSRPARTRSSAAGDLPRRHRLTARRRCARWRSSASSNPPRAALRGSGRLLRPRRRDGHVHHDPHRRHRQTGARTCRRAPASSPTPIPRSEYQECLNKAARAAKALESQPACTPRRRAATMMLVIDNYDSLHLQPRAVARGAGSRGRGPAQRRDHRRAGARARAHRHRRSRPGRARPTTPASRATSSARLPRRACRCSACASATSASPRCTAAPSAARREPVHGKTDEVTHDGTGLFAGIPSPFTATRYHSLCVDARKRARRRSRSRRTTPDGVIMGLRHRELPVFGVQFHPESVLTPEGAKLLANFLDVAGEVPLARRGIGHARDRRRCGRHGASQRWGRRGRPRRRAIARVAAGASLTEDEAHVGHGPDHGRRGDPGADQRAHHGHAHEGRDGRRDRRLRAGDARARHAGAAHRDRLHRHLRHRRRRAAHVQHLDDHRVRRRRRRRAGRQARQPRGLLGGGQRGRARGARRRHHAGRRPTWRAASTRRAWGSCSRSRCTRRCATPGPRAARSASGPSSTSWGRSPTRRARSASCWASTTRVSRR